MKKTSIQIGSEIIHAYVADGFFSKVRGLSFRKSLGKSEAMLFVFKKEGYHAMWMFGMRFPIDIVWVDKNMRVVDVVECARPCFLFCKTYKPKRKSKYVIELNAHSAKNLKIKIGSKVQIRYK